MITKAARNSIAGHILDMAGLHPKDDITKDLKCNRINRYNEDLQKLIGRTEFHKTGETWRDEFRN